MNSVTDLKTITRSLILIAVLLLCVGFLEKAHAVVPAPDGSYPGGNTAEGQNALFSLTIGTYNTAVGWFSLESVTTGSFNTGVGAGTLAINSGDQNTATGVAALLLNTTGSFNTANGALALLNNTTGENNTATGNSALSSNTTGGNNTANGVQALKNNTTSFQNTANGVQALLSNTTGDDNTANGVAALLSNTTGDSNTANGVAALFSNTTGTGNIALGYSAGFNLTTGNNNIDIGNNGVAAEASTIRIGSSQTRAFIAGIRGVATGVVDAIPVLIDSTGQLGTASSSRRYKNEIKPMDQASEAILALKPVTFQYKSDTRGTPQFGLIAEEVAAVNPDLVVRDEKGEIYTVRYEAVNAMLLNEFLKEHRKVEEQEATIAQQRKDFEATTAKLKRELETVVARLKDHDSKIQKVSAQIEVSEPAPQVVLSHP